MTLSYLLWVSAIANVVSWLVIATLLVRSNPERESRICRTCCGTGIHDGDFDYSPCDRCGGRGIR